MGEEAPVTKENIDALADAIISHIDMDKVLRIASVKLPPAEPTNTGESKSKVRLAVAKDKAFCFYYQDNLDILESLGAEIIFFSPIDDNTLPENIDGLYLGGGYPELYGSELSRNTEMLSEIHKFAENNRPIYAECGGFMYLTEGITDLEGNFHKLASVFPTRAVMQTKRASLGYRELTTGSHSCWGPAGTILRGHEFHYSRISPMPADIERLYTVNNDTTEGYRLGNTVGGYMHLHLGYNRQAASNFIQHCKE